MADYLCEVHGGPGDYDLSEPVLVQGCPEELDDESRHQVRLAAYLTVYGKVPVYRSLADFLEDRVFPITKLSDVATTTYPADPLFATEKSP